MGPALRPLLETSSRHPGSFGGSLFPGQKRSRGGFLCIPAGPDLGGAGEGGTGDSSDCARLVPQLSRLGPGPARGWWHGAWGQRWQARGPRTAHMEAINTDRPGMSLQAGRPRWTSKARLLALSEGSPLGPWALGLCVAHWDRESRGIRTPSLSDGTGGDVSFGNLAFSRPLELSPQPWQGEWRGRGLPGRPGAAAAHPTPPRPRSCRWGGGNWGDHMLMQTQG